MNKFFKKQNKKGFSLVETLVALFVFSVAIMATMTVMSQGISNITNAKNKITASFLAQEGIEFIKNMKDSFSLEEDKSLGWNKFISAINNSSCDTDGCYVLTDEYTFNMSNYPLKRDFNSLVNQCQNNCSIVYFKEVGVYFASVDSIGSDMTSFSRKIYFQELDDNNLKIISEVSYTQGGKTNAVSFTDYLTNWAE